MELTLSRKDYLDGLTKSIASSSDEESYMDKFKIRFPEGINTASSLEICRLLQDPSLDSKFAMMKLCVEGKEVEVECPNGEVERFCLSSRSDSVEGIDLFRKEPLALIAISDSIYGHLLKKSIRLPASPAAVEPER